MARDKRFNKDWGNKKKKYKRTIVEKVKPKPKTSSKPNPDEQDYDEYEDPYDGFERFHKKK
tara:strand:- start:328 stop:510 length:183 start_codon:yes stop_codon:yes gene_type:complete